MKFGWVVLALLGCAWAQDETVHVVPRVVPAVSEARLTPPDLTAAERIKVNVDLVLVPVSITDTGRNTPVAGLQREQFRLYEDRAEQTIRYFSSEDSPVSIGMVLDASGSMGLKMDEAKAAVAGLCKGANPDDEFFLITFSDRLQATAFTSNTDELVSQLLFTGSSGRTSLLDAVYAGIQKMRSARYQRKALIVISDGGDNHSRYTAGELRQAIKESDVLVYSIGLFEQGAAISFGSHGSRSWDSAMYIAPEEWNGPQLLDDLSEASGGRMFLVDRPRDLGAALDLVGTTLRHQYVLGYTPSHAASDGRFRKIKVKLQKIPHGWPLLRVDARQGFYAR